MKYHSHMKDISVSATKIGNRIPGRLYRRKQEMRKTDKIIYPERINAKNYWNKNYKSIKSGEE